MIVNGAEWLVKMFTGVQRMQFDGLKVLIWVPEYSNVNEQLATVVRLP